MARTRARGRAAGNGGGVSESSASESELVIASSSAGEGSAIPSESEGDGETASRTSPRKRETSIMSSTTLTTASTAAQVAPSSSAAKKRPFRPARSARKTTQSHSSAAKRRALEAFTNDTATTSESEDELAIKSSSASRLATTGGFASGLPLVNRDISDSEEDENDVMRIETARVSQRRVVDTNATTTDEEEDGDETIWVPVRSGSQMPGNVSLSTSLKRKNGPSSSSRRDESENGTPKPTTAGGLSLRQLARKARYILESAMEDTSIHLSSQDKDTLSDFLGCEFLSSLLIFLCASVAFLTEH